MELGREDRNWLQKQFNEVHARITRSDMRNAELLNEQSRDLTDKIEVVKESARSFVEKHESRHHDAVKFWGMIAAMVTVGAAVGAFLVWLIRQGQVRP